MYIYIILVSLNIVIAGTNMDKRFWVIVFLILFCLKVVLCQSNHTPNNFQKIDSKTNQKSKSAYNIPLVIINTFGQNIPDEPKIEAHMGIIDNGYGNNNYITDSFNVYDGHIGIELRGSSSQSFPKKSFALETRDSLGNNFNVSLLGMPSENDWILIANYTDKTLMRNTFTYDMARFMGYWAPRSRYCELFINGNYQGVYTLTEKIKRDANRVNIKKLESDDIAGDALTGGYILKIDKWTGQQNDGWESNFLPPVHPNGQKIYFQYHYPKPNEIVYQQKNYIQAYIDSFETVLNSTSFNNPNTGYYNYVELNSFVDFFVLNELGKNVDGYRLSSFLYKDRNSENGKIIMGPVWDFDLAYRNADYCDGDNYTGWAYNFGNVCPYDGFQLPFWWQKFLTDSIFKNTLKCRWENLRATYLDTVFIFNYIDSVYSYINQAQQRNFQKWPILGVYVWPNPSPIPQSYHEEIQSLKKWFRNRLNWIDNNLQGNCYNTNVQDFQEEINEILFPNPARDAITIKLNEKCKASCFFIKDILGRNMQYGKIENNNSNNIHIVLNDNVKSGVFFFYLLQENTIKSFKFFVQR